MPSLRPLSFALPLLVVALLPRPAAPCSAPMPGCLKNIFAPAADAGAPTNRLIFFSRDCFQLRTEPSPSLPPELWSEGVPLAGRWEATPLARRFGAEAFEWVGPPLPGGALVQVMDRWGTQCGEEGFGVEPMCSEVDALPLREISSFTTGSGPDLEPPPAPAQPSTSCREQHESDVGMPCGGPTFTGWWAEARSPFDNIQVPDLLRVQIFWRREGEAFDLSRPDEGGPTLDTPQSARPGVWYAAARNLDWAGQPSALTPEVKIAFPDDCSFEVPYPGADFPGDGPLEPDLDASSSASCGGGRLGAGLGLLPLFGVRRRKRLATM